MMIDPFGLVASQQICLQIACHNILLWGDVYRKMLSVWGLT